LHTFKVLAYETLKTKARMIKAFKISHSRERERVTEGSCRRIGAALTIGKSGGQVVIKRESGPWRVADLRNDYELESFKLK